MSAQRTSVGSIRGAATAFSDIASVSAARALSVVLSLVTVAIVAHLLAPRQYALLAYISVIAGLIFTGTASWTSTAVTRYGREELERDGSMRGTSWGRLVVTAPVIALAALIVMALKAGGVLSHGITWALVAIAIATGLSRLATEHNFNVLEAAGRMKFSALATALLPVASIIGIVLLAFTGAGHSATAIALVRLITALLVTGWVVLTVWQVAVGQPVVDGDLLRRMLRFSVPMIAFSVSQYVIQAIDIIILGIYRPAREVGVYAFAYQGYGVLQQVSSTATVVLSPLFVSLAVATREGVIHRFYKRMAPQALLLTSIATGIGASFVPLVVLVAAGHAYVAAAAPLALLLFAWILFSAASFVAPIMVLHERSRALGLISVVAALLNVVGDFVLVGIAGVGIVGPAIATAASLVVIAGGYFYVAADCLQLRPSFPLAMLLPGAAGVAAALAFHGILVPAVGVLAVIVSSIVVFRLAKPFSAQDVDMIDKLDIPEPLKKRVVGVLLRVA